MSQAITDFADAVGAGILGGIDEVTGGASTALIRIVYPQVDCFIEENRDAFDAGRVVGFIAEAVLTVAAVVVTGGAAAGLVIAAAAARIAAKKAAKEALEAGVARAEREAVAAAQAAARRLDDGAPSIKTGSSGGPTAGQPFSQSVKKAALDENPGQTCVYTVCRQNHRRSTTPSPRSMAATPRYRMRKSRAHGAMDQRAQGRNQ